MKRSLLRAMLWGISIIALVGNAFAESTLDSNSQKKPSGRVIQRDISNPVVHKDPSNPAGRRGTFDPGIQRVIENQQKRINQGIGSGELTKDEAKILQDNLQWIRDREANLKADGSLTTAERQEIIDLLQSNNQMIINKKHNPVRAIRGAQSSLDTTQKEGTFKAGVPVPIRERIVTQQQRIDRGVLSGELTMEEAKILQDNLNQVRSELHRFESDDRMTSVERAKIQEKLDLNSRMIEDKKSNPIRRF
ncbi:MAG: hypothetical protein HYY20_04470 [Candidatus Tectomicrobia bacterium]|uniref:Uncharacterized protein n=1 Tax=Tectimicrobiota bacterium TaxID=2528274 RepID=A0A932G069_UNCTE|nr:hypothetical protein [Candidatus Tectomicrobia bacterium]